MTLRLRFRRLTTLAGAVHPAGSLAVVEADAEAWAAVDRGDADPEPAAGVAGQPLPPEWLHGVAAVPAPPPKRKGRAR
jgi:hypothetical protein